MFFNGRLMGMNDRDYMKDAEGKSKASGQDDVIRLSELLVALGKLVVVLLLLLVNLRFPSIWIKIPLALAVLIFGGRWLFGMGKPKPKKARLSVATMPSQKEEQTDERRIRQSKLEPFEAAVRNASKPDESVIRLLIAYDAAGEFGKAKALIQRMDGQVFSASVGEEFRVLAKNYFPIELEPTEDGVRFKLA